MQFIRTGRRAPKGLRTTEEITIDTSKLKKLGTFASASPSELVLTFDDGKTVVVVLQRATTYSEKLPTEDTLTKYIPAPIENEDEAEPPLNPVK